MTTKETIPGYHYEDPAPVYFIPISEQASDDECAQKIVGLLQATGFESVIHITY